MINYRTAKEEHEADLLEKHLERVGERVREASADELLQWYWDTDFSDAGQAEWQSLTRKSAKEIVPEVIMREAVIKQGAIFNDLCEHVSKLTLEGKL